MAATDNRVCHLLEELEQILVDFIREHDVTHAEYRTATEFIIASVKAGEESLLFDVFLEAESVDNDNLRHQGTIEAIEGPFYLPGAPMLEPPFRLPRRADENGNALIFSGRVIDTDGNAKPDIGYRLTFRTEDRRGNDTFRVRDGEVDKIDCGEGRDVVRADQYDVIVDATPGNANGSCERVVRNSTPDSDAEEGKTQSPKEDGKEA